MTGLTDFVATSSFRARTVTMGTGNVLAHLEFLGDALRYLAERQAYLQSQVTAAMLLGTALSAAAGRFFSATVYRVIRGSAAPPASAAALRQAAENCEHRAIGSGGGFGYTSILEGADITLLEAVSLAHWLAANAKERKKQIISF